MKHCKKCGKTIKEGFKFCYKCEDIIKDKNCFFNESLLAPYIKNNFGFEVIV